MMLRSPGLLILSALIAVFGLGHTYDSVLTPNQSFDRFSRIHPDQWLENGAVIVLPELASRGNRLEVNFKSWRPPGAQPAQIRVRVCDELQAQFVVENPGVVSIPLKGSCAPRRLVFEVLNPFVGSESDQRQLGVQVESVRVTSRLGVPLVEEGLILTTTGALFLLSFLISVLLRPYRAGWVALLIPPLSYYFLLDADHMNLFRARSLWFLATAFVGGAVLYQRFLANRRGESQTDDGGSRFGVRSRLGTGMGVAVAIVVAVGAGLRFYGLNFGLPNNFHPDEVPKVNAIMRMVDHGDLDPRYFLHPSLLLYLTYLVNTVMQWFPQDSGFRDTAFLAGRIVSATAGTLSVYFLFVIGRRLYSSATGLIAALLLAVFPLHVTCSRYMKEDALLLCVVLAAIVIMLKAVYEDRPRLLLWAGFVAGISASAKYSGLLTIGIVAGAPWLRSRSILPDWNYFRYATFGVLLAPLGFVMCTPYSVLSFAKFSKDFNSERNHMIRGHTIPFDAWSQYWTYHFSRSIIPGTSLVTTVLSVIGLGILAYRRRIEDLFVIGLVLVFYLPAEWVKAKPAPQPERYILPCLPFMALALAQGLVLLRRTPIRMAVPLLGAVAILAPLERTVQLASEIRNDTRDQMARWMVENLPRGSKVYLDWKPYAPRFWSNEFEVIYVPRATILSNLELKNLRNAEADYLVLSSLFYDRYFSQPAPDAALRELFREVFERVPVLKDFSPKYGTYGFHNPDLTLFSLKKEDFQRAEEELQLKRAGKLERTTNEERSSFRWWRTKK